MEENKHFFFSTNEYTKNYIGIRIVYMEYLSII